MTDDNAIKHNRELMAAPPKGEAQLLRALGLGVGRQDAGKTPLTSGELQHMSLPAPDGGHPKGPPVGRIRTRQCEKTKVVHMRETNHGRVGVTHTGGSGDGRASTRPDCSIGTTFTGDLSRFPAELGRGRAAGVTLAGDPSRGRLTGRVPGVALTGDSGRGHSDNGPGREPRPTPTGDLVTLAGAWGRGLADTWHGRGLRVVLTDASSRGHAHRGHGRGSGLVLLDDPGRGRSDTGHDRVPGVAPTSAPSRGCAAVPHDRALGDVATGASGRGRAIATGHGRVSGLTLTGQLPDRGRVDTEQGRGTGTTLTGQLGRGRVDSGHGRALGVTLTGHPDRGHVTSDGHGRGAGTTFVGSSGRGRVSDGGHGRGASVTPTGARRFVVDPGSRGPAPSTHDRAVGVTPRGAGLDAGRGRNRTHRTHSPAGAPIGAALGGDPGSGRAWTTTTGAVGEDPTAHPDRTLVGRQHDWSELE